MEYFCRHCFKESEKHHQLELREGEIGNFYYCTVCYSVYLMK